MSGLRWFWSEKALKKKGLPTYNTDIRKSKDNKKEQQINLENTGRNTGEKKAPEEGTRRNAVEGKRRKTRGTSRHGNNEL